MVTRRLIWAQRRTAARSGGRQAGARLAKRPQRDCRLGGRGAGADSETDSPSPSLFSSCGQNSLPSWRLPPKVAMAGSEGVLGWPEIEDLGEAEDGGVGEGEEDVDEAEAEEQVPSTELPL